MVARAARLLLVVMVSTSVAAPRARAQSPAVAAPVDDGTALVLLESDGEPLTVRLASHDDQPVAVGASCITPCALRLPIGRIALDYGATGRLGRTERLALGAGGARLVLHPPPALPPPSAAGAGAVPASPQRRSTWAAIGLNTGTVLAVSGLASLLGAAGTLTTGQTLYGNQRDWAYGMLGAGPAMIVAGVVLIAVSR